MKQTFAGWLFNEIAQRGYDLNQRGEQARFVAVTGVKPATLSRLLHGNAVPDIKTCSDLARALGCKTTHVLGAAGLIPEDEEPSPCRAPSRRGTTSWPLLETTSRRRRL